LILNNQVLSYCYKTETGAIGRAFVEPQSREGRKGICFFRLSLRARQTKTTMPPAVGYKNDQNTLGALRAFAVNRSMPWEKPWLKMVRVIGGMRT